MLKPIGVHDKPNGACGRYGNGGASRLVNRDARFFASGIGDVIVSLNYSDQRTHLSFNVGSNFILHFHGRFGSIASGEAVNVRSVPGGQRLFQSHDFGFADTVRGGISFQLIKQVVDVQIEFAIGAGKGTSDLSFGSHGHVLLKGVREKTECPQRERHVGT